MSGSLLQPPRACSILCSDIAVGVACRAKLWEPSLKRWQGFYDHHLLHYLVTTACLLHMAYIRAATRRTERTATV